MLGVEGLGLAVGSMVRYTFTSTRRRRHQHCGRRRCHRRCRCRRRRFFSPGGLIWGRSPSTDTGRFVSHTVSLVFVELEVFRRG